MRTSLHGHGVEILFSEKEFSIRQMSELMKRRDGKWTFPYQNAVVLDESGLKVKSSDVIRKCLCRAGD